MEAAASGSEWRIQVQFPFSMAWVTTQHGQILSPTGSWISPRRKALAPSVAGTTGELWGCATSLPPARQETL